MALSERLALLVSLDADGAVKGLESVGKAADRNLGRAESKLDRAGQRFQKVGTGMLAAAGLAAAGLFKAGQSAADLEQAVGGTEAVFKDASGAIEKFAKTAADKFGLSERAAREATTGLGGQLKGLGFELDAAAAKSIELTETAADLAATYGGTTAEAVQALGAALRGEADPAERFNLFLNQTRVNAKAVELGLAANTSQVDANAKAQATLALITEQSADAQGQAAREYDSASAAMQRANANIENAKAALGEAVAPILGSVADGLSKLTTGFSAANDASGGLVSQLVAYGTVGLGAAGGISFVVGKVIELRSNIGGLLTKLTSGSGAIGAFGRAGVVAAGQLGILYAATKLLDDEASRANLSKLERSLLDLAESGRVSGEAANVLGEDLGDLGRSIERVAKPSTSTQIRHTVEALASFGGEHDQLEQAKADIDDLDQALAALAAQDPESAAAALEAIVAGLPPEAGERLIGMLDDYDGALAEVETTSRLAANATDEAAAATTEAAVATESLTEKLKVHEEALEGVLSATLAQFDSNLGYRRSIDEVEGSLAELLEIQKEHGTNSEEYRDKLLDVEGALLDQAGAAVRMAEDQAKANGKTLEASEKNRILVWELTQLRDSLAPNSPLRTALDQYINRLNAIPANKTTDIVARFSTSGAMQDNRFQRYAGNADGTSHWRGGMTWVGERGPELVDLPRGSRIFDAMDSARMAGDGDTIVIPVTIGGHLLDTIVVDGLKRYTRANGPLPGNLVA